MITRSGDVFFGSRSHLRPGRAMGVRGSPERGSRTSGAGSWTADQSRPTAGPHRREDPSQPFADQPTRARSTDRCLPCPPEASSTGRRYYAVYRPVKPWAPLVPIIAVGAQVALALQGGSWTGSTGFANLEDCINHLASKSGLAKAEIVWSADPTWWRA